MISRAPVKWCCLAVAVLVTAAVFVLAWAFPTFPGDRGAMQGLLDNRAGWLDTAALAVTSPGGWMAALVMMAGLLIFLQARGRRVDAFIVLLSGVPLLAGLLLKELVGRARPDLWLTGSEPSGMSFPSGHSTFAMIFGGILIVLIGETVSPAPARRAIQLGLVLLILAIGASRVYLGVHWPSDVLGGYLFGGAALLGLVYLRNMMSAQRATSSGGKAATPPEPHEVRQ